MVQIFSLFTELSASIVVQDSRFQDETKRLQQQLPHFCWLLRDVQLASDDDSESLTSYVRNEVLLSTHADSGDLGHKLLDFYPDLECLPLPHPNCKPKDTLDESKLAEEFIARFGVIAMHILENMTVKKGYTLKPINGASLAYLAHQYVAALNTPDTLPNLELCWMEAIKQNLLECTEQLLQIYVENMNQDLERTYPVELNTTSSSSLMQVHHQVLQRITDTLKSKAEELLAIKQERLARNNLYRTAERKLHSRIVVLEQKTGRVVGGELLQFIEKNRKASYEQCNETFSSLCSRYVPLNKDDIKKKYYARAIGPEKDHVFSERINNIPGPPGNLQVSRITNSRAELDWAKPNLSKTKLEYDVRTKNVSSNHEFHSEKTANCSMILDSLSPVTDYQVWVHAVNGRWLGQGLEITFRTEPGPPNKPEIMNISTSQSSLSEITVRYKKPIESDANGSNITDVILKYKLNIESSEEMQVCKVAIEDLPNECISVQLNNIKTPNTKYSFQLSFANEFGEGISEHQCFDTMNMIPGPPQNLRVAGRGHERIKLRWDQPNINPGVVCRYIIDMKKFEDTFKTIVERKSLSAVAKNLDSDAKYNFKVKAVNCNNDGQYTVELNDWVETKYHPAIRATLVAGAAVGGTVVAPVVAACGIPAVSAIVAHEGREKKDTKQVVAGVAGVLSTPISSTVGLIAGTLGAPVGGVVFAKIAHDKLDNDSDLADSDDEINTSSENKQEPELID